MEKKKKKPDMTVTDHDMLNKTGTVFVLLVLMIISNHYSTILHEENPRLAGI